MSMKPYDIADEVGSREALKNPHINRVSLDFECDDDYDDYDDDEPHCFGVDPAFSSYEEANGMFYNLSCY